MFIEMLFHMHSCVLPEMVCIVRRKNAGSFRCCFFKSQVVGPKIGSTNMSFIMPNLELGNPKKKACQQFWLEGPSIRVEVVFEMNI